jgi:hypothetical protein
VLYICCQSSIHCYTCYIPMIPIKLHSQASQTRSSVPDGFSTPRALSAIPPSHCSLSPICRNMFCSAFTNSWHSDWSSSSSSSLQQLWASLCTTGCAFPHGCIKAFEKSTRKTCFPFMTKWRRSSTVLCITPALWTLHSVNIAKRLPTMSDELEAVQRPSRTKTRRASSAFPCSCRAP